MIIGDLLVSFLNTARDPASTSGWWVDEYGRERVVMSPESLIPDPSMGEFPLRAMGSRT